MDELQQINAQIAELQRKAKEIEQAQRQPIIDKMREDIKTYGITAKELGLKASRGPAKPSDGEAKEKAPVAPKYRQGENTWTGRGRAPAWIVEFEKNGGKKEQLLIKELK